MKIAFYAPLKSPDHPVPSGDRLMARLLIRALERAGHQVEVASTLRAYLPDPSDTAALARLRQQSEEERDRIASRWGSEGPPDLWFCYHPYYKSPDLVGPPLARTFGLPWVSVEASLSHRRTQGIWAESQRDVQLAVTSAGMNFGLTARDRAGLAELAPDAKITALPPFLDLDGLLSPAPLASNRLVTVAMMRPGDKMESYRALAAALSLLPPDLDWELAVAGDGPERAAVQALFPAERVDWRGLLSHDEVQSLLAEGSIYVWPGSGEAYGLAYLEAQAAGLPVVAWATAGVPEVVADGESGLLTPVGDTTALAASVTRLLADPALRRQMGAAGRERVLMRHSLDAAARLLDAGLKQAMGDPR